ncbi:leucine zipper domain-containing protein [Rhodococcus erythropolis]|nr:leucine zipper domain-containing protein [Rhodococcus erythropolis]MDV6278354.1 leucine zipper domain-containing protein [Rhodococcus erythropolis]
MTHRNTPLSVEGSRRLVAHFQTHPIAHVTAEMGISRACSSKWVNRFRQFGEIAGGLRCHSIGDSHATSRCTARPSRRSRRRRQPACAPERTSLSRHLK